MATISIPDLITALRELFDKRQADLRRSAICTGYLGALKRRLEELEALPAEVRGEAMGEELEAVDRRHDGFAAAVWFMCEAYLRVPSAGPELRSAAERIRQTLVPELGELRRSYAEEAQAATSRQRVLDLLRPDLRRIPVAGGTLEDWAVAYLDSGVELGRKLHNQGAAEPASQQALDRRAAALRLIEQMRRGLREEVAADPTLPRRLDDIVFGRFDQLANKAG